MRIDKFLWCVRYFKTRNMATEACKSGKVRVNGDVVKPAREVYAADSIRVRKNQVTRQAEVLDLPTARVGAKLVGMYIKDTTPQEELSKEEMLRLSRDHYRKKGTGRPTKRDRRDLDGFIQDEDS